MKNESTLKMGSQIKFTGNKFTGIKFTRLSSLGLSSPKKIIISSPRLSSLQKNNNKFTGIKFTKDLVHQD